ncbi:MAG: 1-acyl-sn-glycerol-3-phosphate acyltransferase [Nitriliruptorales bacterium]|nr:1-acyl-sn-glycerol-3-phosphate acyltransferase [Nitriliruptorales bacterium]
MALVPNPLAMRIAQRISGPPLRRWYRAEVTGQGAVPGGGGVLLAANHLSFLDHYLLAAASPRRMRFLGKRELAEGLFGRFNVALGMVPVDRGRADMEAIGLIVEVLRGGAAVGVFPEGSRSPTGALYRFRSGLGRVAAEAQVPCVPVGLIGTAAVWPKGGWPQPHRPPAGTVQVHFGDVVAPPAADARSRRAFTAKVHAQVAKLSGQPLTNAFAPTSPTA